MSTQGNGSTRGCFPPPRAWRELRERARRLSRVTCGAQVGGTQVRAREAATALCARAENRAASATRVWAPNGSEWGGSGPAGRTVTPSPGTRQVGGPGSRCRVSPRRLRPETLPGRVVRTVTRSRCVVRTVTRGRCVRGCPWEGRLGPELRVPSDVTEHSSADEDSQPSVPAAAEPGDFSVCVVGPRLPDGPRVRRGLSL